MNIWPGPDHLVRFAEPIAELIAGYYTGDMISAGLKEQQLAFPAGTIPLPLETNGPSLSSIGNGVNIQLMRASTKLVMRDAYGERAMSLAALNRIGERLAERDPATYRQMMTDANIRCVITDALGWPPGDFGAFLRGEQVFEDGWRPVVPLPLFSCLATS